MVNSGTSGTSGTQGNEDAKHNLLIFLNELTGMDFSDPDAKFDVFELFDAVMKLNEPGAMEKVMDKMKTAVEGLSSQNTTATPEEKLDAAKDTANEEINDIKQEQDNDKASVSSADKGYEQGVNGGALTMVVDNSANGAQPVVNHDTGSITIVGADALERFNDIGDPAQETVSSVDSKVDPDVVNQAAFVLPEQEVTAAQISNGFS